MNLLSNFKPFKISKLLKKIRRFIRNLLIRKSLQKKREILRNSAISNKIFKKIYKNSNIEGIQKIFFENHLFAYSNEKEKEFLIKKINESCSDFLRDCLNYANNIVNNDFTIFEKKYSADDELDWNHSFFTNFRWSFIKSEKIMKHPLNKNVDIKYVWELNRHQFLPYLGLAYYYTGDEKYAKAFKYLVLDWISKNPPLYGINWISGLEVSLRLTSWLFSLFFFKSSNEINNVAFFEKIFKSLFQHAYFLRKFYERKSFNHTVGDLFGLFFFSKVFEKIKVMKKWEKKSYKLLYNEILRQIQSDGTHIEQSINYHRFVLEFFTLFIILNEEKLDRKAKKHIEKMYDFLILIIKPDGTYPLIGDNDDGKVLFLNCIKNNSVLELLNLGSILFNRGDLKFISKKLSLSSILLLGEKGFKLYKNLQEREPDKRMNFFQDAGFFVMRNSWAVNSHYLFVDFSDFGPNNASHSHSDITNIILCYNGKNIINDSGTYSYNLSWEDRNLYRSSLAHNLLTVNFKNQAKIKNWFAWENLPKVKRLVLINGDKIKLACLHDGYVNYFVERIILTNKNLSEILIKDKLLPNPKGAKEKLENVNIFLHFDKEVKIKKLNDSVVINDELKFRFHSKHKFSIILDRSYYSPHYGLRFERPIIKINFKVNNNNLDKLELITKITAIDNKKTNISK